MLHTLNRRFSPPTGFKILDQVDKLNFCCSVFSPAALKRDVQSVASRSSRCTNQGARMGTQIHPGALKCTKGGHLLKNPGSVHETA